MTTPTSPGRGRPARVAGVVLLGLAAIALVIGLITVFGGTSSGDEANPPLSVPPPPTSTSVPPPVTPPSSAPTTSAAPPSSTSSPTTTAPPPPATTSTPGTRAQPVRIYNNSKIKGLAARASDDFRRDGWHVVEVGNYAQGIIATTTVYYRPGTPEEAAAREMAKKFGMRVAERFPGIQSASAGVIVIVTNDYTGHPGKT